MQKLIRWKIISKKNKKVVGLFEYLTAETQRRRG
jgi:hypothetical protein